MSLDYKNKLSTGARWVYTTAERWHLGFVDFIITFVLGWVIGLKVSPTAGAVLVIIGCVLLVWRATGIHIGEQGMSNNARLLLAILALILLPVLAWNSVVNFVTPTHTELSNKYIRLYENPVYNRDGRTHEHALLIEFGVRRSQIQIDIAFNTTENYTDSSYYFGTPLKDDASQNPTTSYVIIAPCHTEVNKSTPLYSIKAEDGCLVYPDKSLYIYFESDYPLVIEDIMFTGEQTHL